MTFLLICADSGGNSSPKGYWQTQFKVRRPPLNYFTPSLLFMSFHPLAAAAVAPPRRSNRCSQQWGESAERAASPTSAWELYANLLTYYLSSHLHNAERHFWNPKCGQIKHLSLAGVGAPSESGPRMHFWLWEEAQRFSTDEADDACVRGPPREQVREGRVSRAMCRVSHLRAVYVNLAAAGAGAMSYYRTLGQRARWLTTWGAGRMTATAGRKGRGRDQDLIGLRRDVLFGTR